MIWFPEFDNDNGYSLIFVILISPLKLISISLACGGLNCNDIYSAVRLRVASPKDTWTLLTLIYNIIIPVVVNHDAKTNILIIVTCECHYNIDWLSNIQSSVIKSLPDVVNVIIMTY